MLHPRSSRSVSTVLRHVSLGLPLFLLPSVCSFKGYLWVVFGFILKVCLIHLLACINFITADITIYGVLTHADMYKASEDRSVAEREKTFMSYLGISGNRS